MKIGFFIINNIVGGGGMIATQNAINTIKEYHDIILFLEEKISDKSRHLLDVGNIKYVEVGKISKYENINKLLYELKNNKIEIFVTHCHYYFEIIKLFNEIKSLNIKIILNEHHYHFIPVYEHRFNLYLNRKEYLKSCDLITTIEKTSYNIWKEEGYKVAYLPNTYLYNKKYKNLKKQKQVLMIGRFTDFKQIELGILAFSLAYENHKDWKLCILGKGPEQKNISNIVKISGITANVKLIPWTSDPDRYFAEASIHLLPSYTEPFGLVIADAKVNNIPTVMFNLKSNKLVRDGIDGYKVEFGNINKMAEALDKLMSSESLRLKMGERAPETLRENKPEYTIKVWNEIFNYVMGKDIIDKYIYNNHFNYICTKDDIDAMIFDYNSLIRWICLKNNKQQKKTKKNNIFSKIYKKIHIYLIKKINNIGKIVFETSQKYFKCNYIILWDSNGVGFMNECLNNKFKLHTKLIIPKTSIFSPLRAYYLARAKVFITNTNTPYVKMLLSKKINIPYIVNIWHACGYFKKFGIHENNIGLLEHRKKFGTPSFVLCSSNEIKEKYAEIFGIAKNKVLSFGLPRTDLLYDQKIINDKKNKFYKLFPELINKKIYLIAPTWRGEPFKSDTAFYKPKMDFKNLAKLLRNDEIIIIKNHQLVIKNIKSHPDMCNLDNINNKIIIINDIDIITLTIVCNVFITDFSSAYFEALILNKPIVFYAEDIDAYNAQIGFYDNYTSYCPGEICNDSDAINFINKIRKAYKYVNTDGYKKIKNKFVGACDGHSSEKLIKFINDLDLNDYNDLWKKYIKKINNIDKSLIFTNNFSRHFYIIYIKDIEHNIHFELLYKNGKKYLCLHFESQKYYNKYYIDFVKSFNENKYDVYINQNKLAIETKINLNSIYSDFKILIQKSQNFLNNEKK
ncbi:hypothetical protein B5F76_14120 [Desulfovibrio sp. An276]|uniref:CDP-glycerol glycerophosphotransferase family protein n=1 Tax=Desulfovibrio sp. An276 TaxID=1965618 RepID=UPI000B385742|nr:CDP-glycerol glycerophosphotransferase family protein [Desulfovibrio sp. An276]OUO49302.1 hypothetical protein B5F76_14120 [Desulfovibrio sp. An276]